LQAAERLAPRMAIERSRDFGALRHFNPHLEAEPPAVALESAEKIDVGSPGQSCRALPVTLSLKPSRSAFCITEPAPGLLGGRDIAFSVRESTRLNHWALIVAPDDVLAEDKELTNG